MSAGLVVRSEPLNGDSSWKFDGEGIWLSITDAGRGAIGELNEILAPASGREPAAVGEVGTAVDGSAPPVEPPVTLSSPQQRPKLRDAATALLTCWETTTEREPLADAVAALRAAMGLPRRPAGPARAPRQGTKQEAVLALLCRPEGATIAHVVEATGWAQHTVRGFFAGLKKRGHTVEVLERVRQVGPGNAGAKGSYSVYRLAEAA